MNVEKKNKIFAGICYVCAIICMVALLICAIVLSKEVPNNAPGNPPTTSSSAPELDGEDGAGDNDDSDNPVVEPQTYTTKVLELIFNSHDFYVYPWANAVMSDLTFNMDFVDVEAISEPFEIAAENFLAEIHAKLGFVSEITIDVLNDDGINNTYEILLNLIYDNTK